jgi:adenosine deaminase
MNKHCDLHLHLGGSISKDLLVEFARSDNIQKAIDYIEQADVLQMFKLVHSLINSQERIEASTKNVINTSTADYLEIRTTPRNFSSTLSLRSYVEAFVSGLQTYSERAKGLLSIDRYRHDIKIAKEIIALATEYSDYIVGIDISGFNPTGTRVLQGEDLKSIIETVLNSPLGLALHIGELNCEKEILDSTISLNTIEQWIELNQKIKCSGKIRLGHALFLEEEHKRIIRKHRLPIEICPSCHRHNSSWRKGQKHPVQEIYTDKESPVVIGTDDGLIFSTTFKREMELAQKELPYDFENAYYYRFGQTNFR